MGPAQHGSALFCSALLCSALLLLLWYAEPCCAVLWCESHSHIKYTFLLLFVAHILHIAMKGYVMVALYRQFKHTHTHIPPNILAYAHKNEYRSHYCGSVVLTLILSPSHIHIRGHIIDCSAFGRNVSWRDVCHNASRHNILRESLMPIVYFSGTVLVTDNFLLLLHLLHSSLFFFLKRSSRLRWLSNRCCLSCHFDSFRIRLQWCFSLDCIKKLTLQH